MPGYHYSYWYDTCNAFFDTSFSPSRFPGASINSLGHVMQMGRGQAIVSDRTRICKSEYTPHPIAITGFGVWIGDPADPEFQPYDYVVSNVLKLPRHVDTSVYGFHYCHLYEVHLSKPIVMDSLFYLTGSFHNNILQGWSYHNIPTVYAGEFVGNYPPEVDCKAPLWTIYSPSSFICLWLTMLRWLPSPSTAAWV